MYCTVHPLFPSIMHVYVQYIYDMYSTYMHVLCVLCVLYVLYPPHLLHALDILQIPSSLVSTLLLLEILSVQLPFYPLPLLSSWTPISGPHRTALPSV